ncbi:MAG: hypothetical protein M1820_004867 [Bogoriella megaspora]|nr:MAG: hypothetical protein M1820_004867 [Bogoriella megaspora]
MKTLILFEATEVKKCRIKDLALDHLLNFNKHVLKHCSVVLDCKSCFGSSSICMLVISIFRNIIGLLEQLLHVLQSDAQNAAAQNPQFALRRDAHVEGRSICRERLNASLGVYQVDSNAEWICIVCVLATRQLNQLQIFMGNLRAIAASWDRVVHSDMLTEIDIRRDKLHSALEEIHAFWDSSLPGSR